MEQRRAVGLLLNLAKDETGRMESAAVAPLLHWGRPRMPELIEAREQRRKKLKEVLKVVEDYCTETAPCSEGFTVEKGLELVLCDLRRYQTAVARVPEKERDQRALPDHKGKTRQEVEAVRQHWLACLDAYSESRCPGLHIYRTLKMLPKRPQVENDSTSFGSRLPNPAGKKATEANTLENSAGVCPP